MNFRKFAPYIAAVAVFLVTSAAYFAPQLSGESLSMHDVTMYDGMKGDIQQHRNATGEDPQWTGGMFGGMPAYLITVEYPAMILRNATQWALNLLGEPFSLVFLAQLCFWLMLLMCSVNPWLSIPFAAAYGFSTYNILIIEAGHITKMRALAYAPMLVGAVFYMFRETFSVSRAVSSPSGGSCVSDASKVLGSSGVSGPSGVSGASGTGFCGLRLWLGGALAALFGALLIAASHHQITYYFLLIVAAFWIAQLTRGWRHRRFWAASGVLLAAGIFAIGANFSHLWYTAQHSPETIRGGSEVAENQAASGLDLDYATRWSYGLGESFNMLVPNLYGGASWGGFSADGEVANSLKQNGIAPSVASQLPGYWGDQGVTGGPTYLGAVVLFLFIFGLFVIPARIRWWLLAVSILGLLLAWGRNMLWFTELAFDWLPGYNKFRTVAMALSILQWSVPFGAAIGLNALWRRSGGEFNIATCEIGENGYTLYNRELFLTALKWSTAISAGICLIIILLGGAMLDFTGPSDANFEGIPGLIDAMRSERAGMMRADAWRSLLFVLLGAGVVWWWISRKNTTSSCKSNLLVVSGLTVIILCDLIPVDLRFLSHDDFQLPARTAIRPDEADKLILADKELGFRVLNAQNPWNEAVTSYFHRSVGGYHGAKLRRYQDVIDRYLSRFDPNVIDLLNTKYIIVTDPESGARSVEQNAGAMGAAWFVDDVTWVDGAKVELDAIGTADLHRTAVVDRAAFGLQLTDFKPVRRDSTGSVKLIEYRPNYLKYESTADENRLAVFSEIFYDKGWTAYIDGVATPYLRADYVLRAMVVPAGGHTIEWRFRAPRFAVVEGITLAFSIGILMWLAAMIFINYRRNCKNISNI